jgi:hypothetical protein
MKKKILFAVFALAAAVLGSLSTPLLAENATAANVCEHSGSPFGITRWCEDLPENPDFTKGRDEIAKYVLILVANIYGMITDVASYVAVILVMWGGFLYVTSSGDPGKSMKGQKTITNSLIGIVIVKGSDIIFKLIKTIATGAKSTSAVGATAGVAPLASYVGGRALFWGGIIAVIMIIWGALQYSMSAGDPGKATKGKKTIISACIGIAIMMFAAIIVTVVINTLDVNN